MNFYSSLLSCCDYQPEGSRLTLKCKSRQVSIALATYRQRLSLEFQTFKSIRLVAPDFEYPTFSVERHPEFLKIQDQIEDALEPVCLVGFDSLVYLAHNRNCKPLAEGLCELHSGERVDRLWRTSEHQLAHLHRELKATGKLDRFEARLSLPNGGELHTISRYQLHEVENVLIREVTILGIRVVKPHETVFLSERSET